jgi:hypothetical protein
MFTDMYSRGLAFRGSFAQTVDNNYEGKVQPFGFHPEFLYRGLMGTTEIFRAYFTTFRRTKHARVGVCLFVLKLILPARSYGLTSISR